MFRAFSRSGRLARRVQPTRRIMFRRILTVAGLAVALFHVRLLSGDLWAGELAEPGQLLRWLVAFGLAGALLALRHQGASLFRGRKAVAIWLLAVLLHGPSVVDRVGAVGIPEFPEAAATLVQVALASAVAAGLRWLLVALFARHRPASVTPHVFTFGGRHGVGRLAPGTCLCLASRPPPGA
jgi:hypothetical protein